MMWAALATGMLVPVSLLVPAKSLVAELFALSGILCLAGAIRLVIASSYRHTPAGNAFTAWAVVTSIGAALLVLGPVLALASQMAVLAFVLVLEAASALNIARTSAESARAWLPHSVLCASLGIAVFLFQTVAPEWVLGVVIGVNLAGAAFAGMRAGLAQRRA